MKRFGLWATLVMAALMVITGFLTGVLPGVFQPPTVQPQTTGIGIPTPMDFARGYLDVYKRLLPTGSLVQGTKTVGVNFSRAGNLDDESRAWLLDQIGRYTGAQAIADSLDELRAQGYMEYDGNLTSYGDGFLLVSIKDQPYDNGTCIVDIFASAGPLNGQGLSCHMFKTHLGWKIDTISTSIS